MGDEATPPLSYQREGTVLTAQDLCVLVWKMTAVYSALQAVQVVAIIPYLFLPFNLNVDKKQLLMAMVTPAIYAAIAAIAWTQSRRFAEWLLPGKVDSPVELAAPGEAFQALAFSVIGVALVAFAIPALIGGLAPIVSGVESGVFAKWLLLEPFLRLAVGMTLMLRARGWSRLWHYVQNAGVRRQDEEEPMPNP